MGRLLAVMAYHGWGFTAQCWQGWQSQFLALGQCQWYSYDRGYWGNALSATSGERPTLSFSTPDRHRILLTHSYGLHWGLADGQASGWLTDIDLLVIFGGFQSFHPSEPKAQRRSQLVLRQMLKQLELDPLTVLRQFYQNCDYPEPLPDTRMPTLNPALLLRDLQALDQAQLAVALLAQIPRIVIFQGLQDQIVPVTQAEQLWEQVRLAKGDGTRSCPSEACQYIPLAGGHALPFTHLETCWSLFQPTLSAIWAV